MKFTPTEAADLISEVNFNDESSAVKECIHILENTTNIKVDKLDFGQVYNSKVKQLIGQREYGYVCELFIEKMFFSLKDLHPYDYETVMPKMLFPFLSNLNMYEYLITGKEIPTNGTQEMVDSLSDEIIAIVVSSDFFYQSFESFINAIESCEKVIKKYSPNYYKTIVAFSNVSDDKFSSAIIKLMKHGIDDYIKNLMDDNIGVNLDSRQQVEVLREYIDKIELNSNLSKVLSDNTSNLNKKHKI